MQPFAAGRPFAGQHQRLPEPPEAVARELARQVGGKRGERPPEAGPGKARQQAAQHAARLVVQIFGEIQDRRPDLVMDRMPLLVGRPSQRHERELEPGLLQPEQFLRDEGLRQARIALEDDDDLAPHVFALRPLTI